jgi:hypothetical protein
MSFRRLDDPQPLRALIASGRPAKRTQLGRRGVSTITGSTRSVRFW